MNLAFAWALFAVLLFFSGLFSGSETGVYSVSRIRLDAEARAGSRSARLLLRALRDDTGLLIALVIGNNLMLELATHLADSELTADWNVPDWSRELVVALLLTPMVFIAGELLPKDLFRRWPRQLLALALGPITVVRVLLLPLSLPLRGMSWLLERMLGIGHKEFARALGKEEMVEILRQGTEEGALDPHAAVLARNVLELRATPVNSVMIPWSQVESVELGGPGEGASPQVDARDQVIASDYSRLPVLGNLAEPATGGTEEAPVPGHGLVAGAGRQVVGYVFQLDVLARPEADVSDCLRPIPSLQPDLPVDKALARLRLVGQRAALVGPPEAPEGLVTVMDLVAAIAD